MIDIESKIISYREDTNDYRLCLTREEIDEIKEILEKQILKKPIIITNLMTKHVFAHCSICDTDITYYSSGENYCHNCGKALKWE